MRCAFVHIGISKTGTTSIQDVLARNRRVLHQRWGLLFPVSGGQNHSLALRTAFHPDPASLAQYDAMARQRFRNLAAELDSSEMSFVLSAEGLSNVGVKEARQFTNWLHRLANDVMVIAYLRHPVSWVISSVQQAVKAGEILEDMVERLPKPRLRSRLAPWLELYGEERVFLYDFNVAKKAPGGIIGHFLRQINVEPNTIRGTGLVRNASLCDKAVRQLSSMNKVRGSPPSQYEICNLATVQGPPFWLEDAIVERIIHEAESDLQWLQEKFDLDLLPQ